MKIVDRRTFLAMPAETLFYKYGHTYFEGDLCIKCDTSGKNDFFVRRIAYAVKSDGSDDMYRILDEAAENSTSFEMDLDTIGRDGCYDEDQLFAVWEPQDVAALIARLERCAGGKLCIS